MGYKRTSELLNIGAALDAVDGTPTTTTITLPLSSLDREIFVVTDIQLDTERLNAQAAPGFAALSASVNKTSTSALTINNPNCLGSTAKSIETTALGYIYQQSRQPDESSTGQMADYIGIIATPNFVLAANFVTTAGGASNRAVWARVTGYRAKADADTYAALVTEEINQ
jgi:hypothetical protein